MLLLPCRDFYRLPRFSIRFFVLLWHCVHKACQLSLSQNNVISPLCGFIWSTTLAAVVTPLALQNTHKGFCFKNRSLAFLHLLSYPRFAADGLVSFLGFLFLLCGTGAIGISHSDSYRIILSFRLLLFFPHIDNVSQLSPGEYNQAYYGPSLHLL